MGNLYLHFDTSVAQGNVLAKELQLFLEKNYKTKIDDPVKEDENTMDLGSILTIVLGASSVIEVAKGIALWMQKKQGLSVTITETVTKDKAESQIVATGVNSKDVVNLIQGYIDIKKTKKAE